MTKSYKKILFGLVLLAVFFVLPAFASAAFPIPYWPDDAKPLISCSGVDCNLCELINTSQNIISFAMTLLLAVFAPIMLAYGGIMIMISRGSPEKFGTGKKALTGAIIGIAVGLGAFLIINEFVTLIGVKFSGGQQTEWHSFTCPSSIIPKPTPPTTSNNTTPTGDKTTCSGYTNGCTPSPSLSNVLGCVQGKGLNLGSIITTGGTHSVGSCHFGGSCGDGGHAVDFGSEDNASAIFSAMQQCASQAGVSQNCRCENEGGTKFLSCGDPEANHIHCNVDNARCGCK